MLPEFDAHGNLPPGIYRCSLDEVIARFGQGSEERKVGANELGEVIEWAKRAGVERLIVDGSYVTAKETPMDVDVVILPGGDYPRDQAPAEEIEWRWPLVHMIVATDDADFDLWAKVDFAIDRKHRHRGVLEIPL